MPRLTTLILHPEADVRQGLRQLVSQVSFLRVVGEAVCAEEALELLNALPYGVIFSGINLQQPEQGLELAQRLLGRKHKPALIFIAEDETHAFAGFELDATDYLIWPCTEQRFARTVSRLKQFRSHFKLAPDPGSRWQEQSSPSSPQEIQQPEAEVQTKTLEDGDQTLQVPLADDEQDNFLDALKQAWDYTSTYRQVDIEKLAITYEGKTLLLPYDEIVFVEAYEDYTYVHTAEQKYLTSYRLKILEGKLKPHRFFRVHRKYLVNLNMVTEIASLPGSSFMLRTAGRTRIELPISRRRIGELKQVLGL
ncbi:LytR/AlgR family response regulator transcription factor [Oleidesulfovibrio sp.]|uniref:LytR/AlgR family response regulator transcription factor n=1 Tax=Oleidesulfovibrio sp. TaxID=2909707 RepID=UPI003A885A99